MGDVHEAVKLARLLPGEAGAPRRFVDLAFPYQDARGNTAGVLGVHLSWKWAREVERSVIAQAEARGRVQALIVSAQGVVLLGPPGLQGRTLATASLALGRQKRSGYLVEQWPDGVSCLVGYGATAGRGVYPGLGWTVLVRQDIEDAYAPVRRLRARACGAAPRWRSCSRWPACWWRAALPGRWRRWPARPNGWDAARRSTWCRMPRTISRSQALTGTLNALVSDLVRQRAELRDLNATLERRVEQRTGELERALAAVQASEQRINSIIDSSPEAYIAVDQRGLVLEWNRAAERMFGWRRQDALGWPLAELVLPERYRASLGRALHTFRPAATWRCWTGD